MSGLDYDPELHDLWALAERVPRHVTLFQSVAPTSRTAQRLLRGDWPRKRNLIIQTSAASLDEGRRTLQAYRRSIPE